jgi:hypothetical protein
MKNQSREFEKFDATVRRVLSVSREELKRREEEWKLQHAGRKAGRKAANNAVSSPSLTGKD